MIGRESELRQILRQIEQMIEGNTTTNVLFITGEAGIGKSTLLGAVRAACGGLPAPPLVALAECSTPLAGQEVGDVEALEPWATIMRQLASADHHAASDTRQIVARVAMAWVSCIPVVGNVIESAMNTAKILHEGIRADGSQSPRTAASQQQVFQQYINVLESLSERTGLVLMIDDLHWADASSVNLLFAAARQLQGKRAQFVVAYRPDDATSARGGEGHPLLHVRRELERYGLTTEVGVPGMVAADLDLLLRDRYSNYQDNGQFEHWLAAISDGNALFITQFLKTLEEDGVIDRSRGAIGDGYRTAEIPRSVGAVIQERIRRLSEDARELLQYASVEGDTFTAAILSRVTETSQLKLLQKLRLIEQTHQVIKSLGKQKVYTEESTTYQFGHTLMHKLMYESLGEEERELLHDMILGVLKEEWEEAKQSGVNVPGMAARMAVHAEVMEEYTFAAGVLLEGALSSWKNYAEEETLHLLDAMFTSIGKALVDAGPDNADLVMLQVRGYRLRVEIHLVRSRFSEMLSDARQVLARIDRHHHAELWIDTISREAMALHSLADNEAAETRARQALTEAERIGYAKGEVDAASIIGHVKGTHGMSSELLEWRLRAAETASRIGSNTAEEATALSNLGAAYRGLGEYDAAAECYRQSLAICRATGDQLVLAMVLNNMGSLYLSFGETEKAREHLAECQEVCRSTGNDWNAAYCLHNLGYLEQYSGRLEEALEYYDRALTIVRRIDDDSQVAGTLRNMGDVHEQLGDFSIAIALFSESLKLYEGLDNPDEIAFTCAWLARLYLATGEIPMARQLLERAYALAQQWELVNREAEALGGLGLVEEAEAHTLDGNDRRVKLVNAVAHLVECVRIYRAAHSSMIDEWEPELERVKGIAGAEPSPGG